MPDTASRAINLQALIGDMALETFDREIRDKQRLHVPGALTRNEVRALFPIERFDEIVTGYDIAFPDVDLIENGVVTPFEQTKRKRAVHGTLSDKVAKGVTLRIRALGEVDARVRKVALALSDNLDGTMQVNAFLTPPHSDGFVPHYDQRDIWVVQTHGSKTWRLHQQTMTGIMDLELPLYVNNYDPSTMSVGPVIEEITLREGDTLYLPRGTGHSATCTDEPSLHITFMLAIVTVGDIATNYLHHMHLARRNLRERVTHAELANIDLLTARLQEDGLLGEVDTRALATVAGVMTKEFMRETLPMATGSVLKALRPPHAGSLYDYVPETIWRVNLNHGVQRLYVGRESYDMGDREMAMIREIAQAGTADTEQLQTEYADIDVVGTLRELEQVGILRLRGEG
jgi:Cupin superfamily protein